MKKIPSLFVRDFANNPKLVTRNVTTGCEWVLAGEGVATRKFDGTACLVRGGELFKRYDAKHGKTPPAGFIPSEPAPDPNSGHWPGWLPIAADNPADKYHWEALSARIERLSPHEEVPDGTYELIGPKVQGNPEQFREHLLIPHGAHIFGRAGNCPEPARSFELLRAWFVGKDIEGIVWHHEDGRMVKLKKSDFGLRRPE